MREWLTSRCILIAVLLVAAPGAALAHLVVSWIPSRLEVARLEKEIARRTEGLDAEWRRCEELRAQRQMLRAATAVRDAAGARWLPQRDEHGVFDRVAEAFRDNRVSIEKLTMEDPKLYPVTSESALLAYEPITIYCAGGYTALTNCLDRLMELGVPLRCADLAWQRTGEKLELSMRLEAPFVPDEPLRTALADAAGIREQNDEP